MDRRADYNKGYNEYQRQYNAAGGRLSRISMPKEFKTSYAYYGWLDAEAGDIREHLRYTKYPSVYDQFDD